jgi:hypothetical protein
MDKFEKFIQQNKSEFDEHQADTSKIWNAINLELDKPKTKVIPLWKSPVFKIAASIALALGILSIINFNMGITTSSTNNSASLELQEIDMYYQKMVQAQIDLVRNNTSISDNNKKEFLSFMDELDAEYKILKIDLGDNIDNERVLEAIVNNYKKRIELIENLLEQINDSKKETHDDAYIL